MGNAYLIMNCKAIETITAIVRSRFRRYNSMVSNIFLNVRYIFD